jgi:hypothetical protein
MRAKIFFDNSPEQGDNLATVTELPEEPTPNDPHWNAGAYALAEEAARKQLVRVHGSVEAGHKYIGLRAYDKWVSRIETAIESENPEE